VLGRTLAHMAKAPVVPCVILGTDRLYAKHHWLPLRRTPIWIAFGKAISPNYDTDKTSARLMRDTATGNGRRQSYSDLPMTRMTNTFLENGPYDPQEIIASVRNGIYAVEFSGGTVDITSGQFNFSAEKAFLIEDGKVTAPIEGATLIGVGNQTLKAISMIGNDLALDGGVAMCGKNGQMIPVGVGQPTIRIDNVVVGGAGG